MRFSRAIFIDSFKCCRLRRFFRRMTAGERLAVLLARWNDSPLPVWRLAAVYVQMIAIRQLRQRLNARLGWNGTINLCVCSICLVAHLVHPTSSSPLLIFGTFWWDFRFFRRQRDQQLAICAGDAPRKRITLEFRLLAVANNVTVKSVDKVWRCVLRGKLINAGVAPIYPKRLNFPPDLCIFFRIILLARHLPHIQCIRSNVIRDLLLRDGLLPAQPPRQPHPVQFFGLHSRRIRDLGQHLLARATLLLQAINGPRNRGKQRDGLRFRQPHQIRRQLLPIRRRLIYPPRRRFSAASTSAWLYALLLSVSDNGASLREEAGCDAGDGFAAGEFAGRDVESVGDRASGSGVPVERVEEAVILSPRLDVPGTVQLIAGACQGFLALD